MKLVLVTSGLELGRDGVGDYCRRLGRVMAANGHEVALLALNDAFAKEESSKSDAGGVLELRLASHCAWGERWTTAMRFVDGFAPDLISLHFVCYGFHPRGWVGGFSEELRNLVSGRKLHLMMHELWVMWGMKCRLPDRLLGVLQQRGVRKVLRNLQATRMDTTIAFYREVLRREGFQCGLLPLCGNFTPVAGDAQNWLGPRLAEATIPGLWPRTQSLLVAGFFGTIFGHWDPMPLLRKLAAEDRRRGCDLLLLSGGSCSPAGERLFDRLPGELDGVRFHRLRLGRLTDEEASHYLNTLDIGLSCYSKLFIGKSSAAATMLDHGLTVVAGGSDPKLEKAWNIDPQVSNVAGLNEPWPVSFERRFPADSAEMVAKLLLARLNGIQN